MVAGITDPQATSPRRRRPLQLTPKPIVVTMRALDRLPWPMQHRLTVAGVRVLVRSSSTAAWETILEHLPAGRRFGPDVEPQLIYSVTPIGAPHLLEPVNQHVVYRGVTRVQRDKDPDVVFKGLLSDLTAVVAMYAPRWTLVHAGAVSWKGRGIILPGAPGSGKSTLVAALLRRGALYHSDEVAIIDAQGRLHPYHKPLWLQTGPGAKEMLPVSAMQARKDFRSRPVGMVAFPERKAGTVQVVTPVARSMATLGLFSNGLGSRGHPERTLQHATRAVEDAICVHLSYPDAEAMADELLRLLDSTAGSDESE